MAARFIALIGKLYRVEALAKEQGLDVNALLQSRQTHSVPVLQEIQALLLANVHAVLPGSLLGKALHYRSSLRISAIVDACFRLIVDGESVLPWRRWGSAQELV